MSRRSGKQPPSQPAAPSAVASTYLLLLSSQECGGRRFVRLRAPDLLAWFQRVWSSARGGAERRQQELGGEVFGLESLFDTIAVEAIAPPPSEEALVSLLERHLAEAGDVEAEPHFVHVDTDHDGRPIEYFLFDETFLESGEALDRLPSLEHRAGAEDELREDEDDERSVVDEVTEEDDDEDGDSYPALLERLMDQ